jgi:hypothetical protein
LSAKSAKYNARRTAKKWETLHGSPPTQLTAGTLFYMANEADPDWRERYVAAEFVKSAPVSSEALAQLEKLLEEVGWEPAVCHHCGKQVVRGGDVRRYGDEYLHYECVEPFIHAREAEAREAKAKEGPAPGATPPEADEPPKAKAPPPPPPPGTRAPPRSRLRGHWHGDPVELNVPWLIKRLLPRVGVGFLAGQWGMYKTFVALNLAGHVMTGKNFIDYPIRRKGGVMYVALEGGTGLALRLQVMAENTLRLGEKELLPFYWENFPLNLLRGDMGPLIALANDVDREMRLRFAGTELVMIVIDTIAIAAGFTNSNSSAEGQAVLNSLRTIAEATRTLVLGVEHFGKDEERGILGTAAKELNADAILTLTGERPPKAKSPQLNLRKVKEAEDGRIVPFRAEVVNCGVDPEDNLPVTSCVIHWEPGQPPAARNLPGRKAKVDKWKVFTDSWNAAADSGSGRVPLAELREAFVVAYMAKAGNENRAAAGTRWGECLRTAKEQELVSAEEVDGTAYLTGNPTPF